MKEFRLSSPRLTVGLLLALAVGGVVGCLIPQDIDAAEHTRESGILSLLFLHRVFTSWWFLGLLCLLLVNLAACVSRSVRRARKRAKDIGWTAVASPVLHGAILLVAVGAILGRVPGLSLRESVVIIEGDETRVRNTEIQVGLQDFWMRFDDQTDEVSAYISEVTFRDETGDEDARIEVNRPAGFRSCQFQQVSWGLAGVWVELTPPEGESIKRVLPLQEADEGAHMGLWEPMPGQNYIVLDGEDAALVATIYYPEAEVFPGVGEDAVQPTGRYPRKQFMLFQGVSGIRGGEHEIEEVGWASERGELRWRGWKLKLREPVFYSVLGVRRDPGLPFVWAGFALLSLALMVMLFAPGRARA